MYRRTDDVDEKLAVDSGQPGVVSWIAVDVGGPGHELLAILNAARVRQPPTTSTNEQRRRPRHVTRPS